MNNKDIIEYFEREECVDDVVILDLINTETLENTGISVRVLLSRRFQYDIKTLDTMAHTIGADACCVSISSGHLLVKFSIHK